MYIKRVQEASDLRYCIDVRQTLNTEQKHTYFYIHTVNIKIR